MLPAVGVVLPSGSQLKGGTLSTALTITGTTAKPVITGPIRLSNSQLAGFDLGSKLSAISALSGAKTGSNTQIQNLSTDARVAPEGIRTDNISLTIPALGVLTGNGTISPSGELNYKMNASLAGGAVGGLTQLVGASGKMSSIPFFIQGTTSDPRFVPDVKGMMNSQLKSRFGLNNKSGQSPVDAIKGLFGKKKKNN
jgi:AsmA protein